MELREFVSETIKQIIDVVSQAQEYAHEHNAWVNPGVGGFSFYERKNFAIFGSSVIDGGNPMYAQIIEFDVAIIASKGGEAKGGAGLFIASIGLGLTGKTDFSNSFVNRIQFSIPVILPQTQEQVNE
jgi:hypothetical protein